MDEIAGLIFRVTNSVILAKYCAAFLTPKSKKASANIVFISFGIVYLISQYFAYFWANSMLAAIPVHVVSFIIFITLFLVTFLFSFVIFEKNLGIQIYLICSFFVVQEICFFISRCLHNTLSKAVYYAATCQGILSTTESTLLFQNRLSIIMIIIHMFIYAILYFLSIQSIIKSFSHKRQLYSLTELLYLILPCLSGFALVFIMRAIDYTQDYNGNLETYIEVPYVELLMPLAGIVFLISLIAAVKLFQKLAELHNEEKEKVVLQKQMQQLQEQITDIGNIFTDIRGMRHDMKSHVSNMQLLLKAVMDGNKGVSKELGEYLGKFGNALDKYEFVHQTGNSISDVIIHQKYLEAVNNGTNFTSDFIYPARLKLDAYDLAVILNNALENAIEACTGVTQTNRFIRLYAYIKGEMFFIEVENSYTGHITLNEHSNLPASSKLEKTVHGMGLSNIQRCARKYYGDIDIQFSEANEYGVYRLIVMLEGKD